MAENDDFYIAKPESIRKTGYTFDSFQHQTFYDSLKEWSEAWRGNVVNCRFAYAQVLRMTIPLLMQNPKKLIELSDFINTLNSQLPTATANPANMNAFFIATEEFLHKIAVETRKSSFVPPVKTPSFKPKTKEG